MKQLINFLNPNKNKRQLGVLDTDSGNVHDPRSNETFKITTLTKKNQDGGIGWFETRDNGKIIQKTGRFIAKK